MFQKLHRSATYVHNTDFGNKNILSAFKIRILSNGEEVNLSLKKGR